MNIKHIILLGFVILSAVPMNAAPTEAQEDPLKALMFQLEKLAGPRGTLALLENYPKSKKIQDLLKEIAELYVSNCPSTEFQETCEDLKDELKKIAKPFFSYDNFFCLETSEGKSPGRGEYGRICNPFAFFILCMCMNFAINGLVCNS